MIVVVGRRLVDAATHRSDRCIPHIGLAWNARRRTPPIRAPHGLVTAGIWGGRCAQVCCRRCRASPHWLALNARR